MVVLIYLLNAGAPVDHLMGLFVKLNYAFYVVKEAAAGGVRDRQAARAFAAHLELTPHEQYRKHIANGGYRV